jgi:hypothetical protein
MMMISRHGSVNRTATAAVAIKIIARAMDQMQRVSNVSKVATVMVSASRAKRINVRGAGESVDIKIKKTSIQAYF